MGTVTLTQGPQGVLVSADLRGLPPGGHGFHIHAVGSCSPDFSAAGGHFGPGEESHGFMHSTDMHAGDLPNLYAHADGTGRTDAFTADITLAVGDERSLFDSDGSAIVVHEKPDAYGEDAGTAGARHGPPHGSERRPHPRDRTPGPLEAGRRHGRPLHPRRIRRVRTAVSVATPHQLGLNIWNYERLA